MLAPTTRDQLFDCTMAWIDNYGGGRGKITLNACVRFELNALVHKNDAQFSVEKKNGMVQITIKSSLMSPKVEDAGFAEIQTWSIDENGRMAVNVAVSPTGKLNPKTWVPRIGVRIPLVPELSQVSYYGLGPHANYVDRLDSAWMGIHTSTVMDNYEPYIRPQDHGNREAVRWLEVKDASGYGLKVVAPKPLAMSALPYTQEEMLKARHTIDLPKKPTTTELRIAPKVSGVGNGSCGPGTEERHKATAESVEYSFVLMPIMP
jgi:beta-galactosidase